ncbi:TetR/AcrR family transcriptional regulator [Mycetocola lacteus]|uniref:TetR/AcrR family transcriptional regulator n=1 Tax=Mycetocola lacteus TaxID=76637 RepID=A0A3L7AIA9_9MICO|nr:TetR/AcrR family transcriptional regulator [Mycetocola lacteus]RLP80223.1 TetR/AcrR family transcriptional regulator [Mycetocola lacteus]
MTSLRADAARNHAAILRATGELFDDAANPQSISMDEIAAAAGVGKGTLFRRFGDRQGLICAVVEERSKPFQAAVLSGPPPLGPGTPADERILAVLDAIITFKLETLRLSLASETVAADPYLLPIYTWCHTLLVSLLRELGRIEDPDFTAHMLLSPTRVDFLVHEIEVAHFNPEQIRARIRATVAALIRPAA